MLKRQLPHRIPSLVGHRFYFVVPWEGRVNIGTTDTDYAGSRENPPALESEVAEILGAINAYFPDAGLEPSDVITSWAGLRPLISDPGVKNTTDISRQEEVLESADGLISIAGGKLTTYRLMAENGINLAQRRLLERGEIELPQRSSTANRHICGGDLDRSALSELARRMAAENELPLVTAEHLVFNYGSEAPQVLELCAEDENLRQPLIEGLPHIVAEALYAIRAEMAVTVTDVMTRRTRLAMLAGAGSLAAARTVAGLIGRELGLSREEQERQIEEYRVELMLEYSTPGQNEPTR
ncbi:MAG: FAD-dependent oxidoreductase [Acidobacteria bacterium]|nr:FAD-dependent oxidoreductase [Acidobacteriota bacterium]